MLSLKTRPKIQPVVETHHTAIFRKPKLPGCKRRQTVMAKFRILEWKSLRDDWEPLESKIWHPESDENGVCLNYPKGEEKVLNVTTYPSGKHIAYSVVFITLP